MQQKGSKIRLPITEVTAFWKTVHLGQRSANQTKKTSREKELPKSCYKDKPDNLMHVWAQIRETQKTLSNKEAKASPP